MYRLSPRIILRTADRPDGPWSDIAQVEGFAPPTGFPWTGPAVAHAELARERGRVETLTYVRNSGNFQSEMRVVEVEFRRASRARSGSETVRKRR